MTSTITPEERARVALADRNTIAVLEEATDLLEASLKRMPNSVASVFAPDVDVPVIARALESVRLVHGDARLELERQARENGEPISELVDPPAPEEA